MISARESNRENENSRKKVQNIVTDSTVNLYDWIVCIRDDTVQAIWPVSGRAIDWNHFHPER